MISERDILIRILFGALLGALVGFDRERHNQPAGLRTHILLVIGSTMAMTLSVNLAIQFQPLVPNGDPARLAAQVVSGIGFLGAGAILRYGTSIKGLTTATSLWTMAVVGLASGLGMYLVAGAATVLILIVLSILDAFEARMARTQVMLLVTITGHDRSGLVDEIQKTLTARSHSISSYTVEKNVKNNLIRVEALLQVKHGISVENLIHEITQIQGVRSFKVK